MHLHERSNSEDHLGASIRQVLGIQIPITAGICPKRQRPRSNVPIESAPARVFRLCPMLVCRALPIESKRFSGVIARGTADDCRAREATSLEVGDQRMNSI